MRFFAWATRSSSRLLRFFVALWLIFGVLDEVARQRTYGDVPPGVRELGESDEDEDGGRDE